MLLLRILTGDQAGEEHRIASPVCSPGSDKDISLRDPDVASHHLLLLGQTLASTAHYLKNLLTGLTAGADLVDLGLKEGDMEAIRTGWGPIRENLDLIQDMVLNMLDYSKDRGPALEEVKLDDFLASIVELVRSRAASQGSSVELSVEPDLPILRVDRTGLHRAILNLLTNAIEAAPTGQRGLVVLLGCRSLPEEPAVVISVQDNGIGIPAERLPRVFDILYSSKGNRGTGFGLAVTRKIVEEHLPVVLHPRRSGSGRRDLL